MKILFLDVDGVLNHSNTEGWQYYCTNKVLDPECCKQLCRILKDCPDVEVVLSSTWRFSDSGTAAIENLIGNRLIDKTPALFKRARRHEIQYWLESFKKEEVTRFAILDDDEDAKYKEGAFFQTDFESGGLTKEIADNIIKYFNHSY